MTEPRGTTPQGAERLLKAIMFSDVKSFSAMMGANEERTVRLVKEHREIVREILVRHHGDEHGTAGDSFFVLFASAVDAVKCAVEIQETFHRRNAGKPENEQIWIRIGIHLGDILIDKSDNQVYGDGVNIAARTEPMAEPGGICITRDVYQQVCRKLELRAVNIGRREMKNIIDAPELFRIMVGAVDPTAAGIGLPSAASSGKGPRSRRPLYAALTAVAVLAAAVLGYLFYPKHAGKAPAVAVAGNAAAMSVTILPFDNVAKNTEFDWLGVGLAGGFSDSLQQQKKLKVLEAPGPAMVTELAKTKSGDALAIALGREAGARWVIAGNFTVTGSDLQVTAKLALVDTARILTVVQLKGRTDAVLTLQADLTKKLLTEALGDILGTENDIFARTQTTNDAAYAAYSKAKTIWRRDGSVTPENFPTFVSLYEEALRLDPQYAEAYSGIASVYYFASIWSGDIGMIRTALRYADQYAVLMPDKSWAHSSRCRILTALGSYRKAIEAYEKARSIDPDAYYEASTYELVGRLDREEQLLVAWTKHDGEMFWPWISLASFYVRNARFTEARRPLNEALRIHDEALKAGDAFVSRKAGWIEPIGAHELEGELLFLTGDRAGAAKAFQTEIDMLAGRTHAYKPSTLAACHVYLSLIAEASGNKPAKANADAGLTNDLAQGGATVLNSMAWGLASNARGDQKARLLERAAQFAEKAVADTGRKNPFFLDTLAQIYEKQGLTQKALAVNTEGSSLLPEGDSFLLRAERLAKIPGK